MRKIILLLASTGLVVLLASVVALGLVNTRAQAAFPGANGRIAVVSDERLYTMNPNGTDKTYLPGTEDARDPSWSPDGQKIAFSAFSGGDSEVYIIDLNTEQVTPLTNNAAVEDRYPTWSPNGQKIAFASDRDGDYDIYKMNAAPQSATNVPKKLTTNTKDDLEPAWSPNGGKITFARYRDGGNSDIYIMDNSPSTEGATNISRTTSSESSPDWSPSGEKIAFANSGNRPGIYVMNKDGSNKNRVAFPRHEFFYLPPKDPAWSPNGRKIAYSIRLAPDEPASDSEIFVINKDGSNKNRLTNNTTDDSAPDWQPIIP